MCEMGVPLFLPCELKFTCVCACADELLTTRSQMMQEPSVLTGHTLTVVALDLDTSHGAFVLCHGLQQSMALSLQLPHTHLQQENPLSLSGYAFLHQILFILKYSLVFLSVICNAMT